MAQIKLFIKLGRFQFLLFGFLCYVAGALLAVILGTSFSWDRFLLGYIVLSLAHLSVSYSNDYWDYEVDHFNQPTRFAGGSGILVKNPELRSLAKQFSLLLITLSIFLAIIFTLTYSSPTFLIIAIIGNILAWYYSAPPLRLSYIGLGEISTALTGFILPSLGYVAINGYLDMKIFLFTLPFILYMIFFILSVEIPDLEGDKKGGKNTFIVKKGREIGFILIALVGVMATLSVVFLSIHTIYSQLNLKIIVLASLVPTIVGLYAFFNRTSDRTVATKLVNLTVPSLVIFITILDLYFFVLIIS